MKPTYTLKTTAHTSSTAISAATAFILAPVMEAAAQTMKLGDKSNAAPVAKIPT